MNEGPHWPPRRRPQKPVRLPNMRTLAEVERAHILDVLVACGNNRTHTAKVLDISRATLVLRLHQYGFDYVEGWHKVETG